MAMPQCCYLAKGAKRPSHTTNTIKFDRIPFDPCNSIKRFDLCPFDQKNSTYLQPPLFLHLRSKLQLQIPHLRNPKNPQLHHNPVVPQPRFLEPHKFRNITNADENIQRNSTLESRPLHDQQKQDRF